MFTTHAVLKVHITIKLLTQVVELHLYTYIHSMSVCGSVWYMKVSHCFFFFFAFADLLDTGRLGSLK